MTGRGVRVSVLLRSLPFLCHLLFAFPPAHLPAGISSLPYTLLWAQPCCCWSLQHLGSPFSFALSGKRISHLVEMLTALVFQDYSGITQLSWIRSNNKIHGNV